MRAFFEIAVAAEHLAVFRRGLSALAPWGDVIGVHVFKGKWIFFATNKIQTRETWLALAGRRGRAGASAPERGTSAGKTAPLRHFVTPLPDAGRGKSYG